MRSVLIALAAFAVMEPVTALTHRFVMHGAGMVLHRSHHRRTRQRWEANDWFPVAFAAIVMGGLAVGFNVAGAGWLVPVGVGVTLYGAVYGVVHDLYIHRRFGIFGDRRIAVLERLADAHAVHHARGAAPYGMLVPVLPGTLRQVPVEREASGSAPFHVPADA